MDKLVFTILLCSSSGIQDCLPFFLAVLDLLEALNITRSVLGVTKAKGPDPGVPAWKFRPRVPHLTLPWDYSVYLLSTVQGALGFHFVARQSRGSEGTLISLVSPAALKRDGHPLLQLVSNTRADHLRLDYRAVHNMEPARLVFPTGNPFAHSRWVRLALNLEPLRITLFVDCQEPFIFGKSGGEEVLSLILPLDLQITFASVLGDKTSKFLVRLRALPDNSPGEHLLELDSPPLHFEPLALTDIRHYQREASESDFPPFGSALRTDPAGPEERIRRLEELVDGLGTMLDMVKEQNSDLLVRVKSLEECECRPLSCVWEGRRYEDGASWEKDACATCTCIRGRTECSLRHDRPHCLGNSVCKRRHCAILCRSPARPRPGTCCPVCDGCLWEEREYRRGETVPSEDPCQRCTCLVSLALGRVQPDIPLSRSREVTCENLFADCPPLSCSHPARRPGQCCPTCEVCDFEGRLYPSGETFTPAGESPCLHCTCTLLNARLNIHINLSLLPSGLCPVCILDSIEFEDGTEWEPEGEPCRTCVCHQGEPVCSAVQCPPVPCQHPAQLQGACCPECQRCSYNQRLYNNGQEFLDPDNLCQSCQCADGTVSCSPIVCPPATCPRPQKKPGSCCAKCPDCTYENRIIADGEEVPSPLHPCQACICTGGEMRCMERQCPGALCAHPLLGSCCQNNCNGCNYAGKEYPNGAEFPHPTDKCRKCHCINGNVQCLTRRCLPLPCPEPFSVPGECCPRCPAPPATCVYLGLSYQHMERFYDPSDKCRDCICTNGTITCQRQPCVPVQCSHPLRHDCCLSCDGCLYQGKELPNGEQFADPQDPCGTCSCWEGSVTCKATPCPPPECPFPTSGPCCKVCEGCEYLSEPYLNGQEFPDPQDTCGICTCLNGFVTCAKKPCYQAGCSHPLRVPGQCCPVCQGCSYNGLTVANGQTFADPGDPLCSQCTCRAGSVQCLRKLCPPAPCAHPVQGPCACPLCQGCSFQGNKYGDGEAFASPNKPCEECRCLRGEVSCAPRFCSTPLCPHPSKDPCGCPVCNACSFHGRDCDNGELFLDPRDPCGQCKCSGGTVTCVPAPCPPISCQNPITLPGQCCPKCTGACRYHGQLYKSGEAFVSPEEACHTCTCQAEVVTCQPKPCPQKCTHPEAPKAPSCCPSCDGCLYKEHSYANGQTFTPPSDPCKRCSCLHGNVLCAPVVCPQVPCANPRHEPGQCCPQCPAICQHAGREYAEGKQWVSSLDPCQRWMFSTRDGLYPTLALRPHFLPSCSGCTYEGRERPDGSSWLSLAVPCMACMCVDGVATCAEIACIRSCTNQINVPGECCPLCADCIYEGLVYGPGESFQPGKDPCEICTCEHLQCYRKQCPSLLDCPREQIQVPGPGHCCPTCAQALSNCTPSLVGNEVLATDEPCYSCQCKDLTWVCMHQSCPLLSCPAAERFVPRDACCPVCDECVIEVEGRRVSDGETWTDSTDSCVSCSCKMGHIECHIQECMPLLCQDGLEKVQMPGRCCAECQGKKIQRLNYSNQLFLHAIEYAPVSNLWEIIKTFAGVHISEPKPHHCAMEIFILVETELCRDFVHLPVVC
uniref:VWFC domain-containing protein n=1 Tax=Anolis carolinensis TaxID=28377 RepID=H9GHF0_ANOCA